MCRHGNGWAYTITDQETGDSFFVQDEEAAHVQHETDNFTDEEALGNFMDGLGEQA